MEEIQQKALRLADRLKVHNNQTRILKEKFVDSNIHFLKGHQFTVDLTLINYCKGLIDLNKEIARLSKRLNELKGHLAGVEKKLANENF